VTMTKTGRTDGLFGRTHLSKPTGILIDTLSSTGILVFTADHSREQTSEPQYHWYQATDNPTGQLHLLADPTMPLPPDTPPSTLNTPEDLERLAAPLLAIERGLPLLSRLLAR
ncbi:MAG: hypothetical protein J2P37_19150, partial [Ktedonobacteraceae bacterium]|nr:hypothetical protein [Ktedonobacteraceae bacterium]